MSSSKKRLSTTLQRGHALAGFARRATIGSLFPSSFLNSSKSKVHCPPIAELSEEEKQKDNAVEDVVDIIEEEEEEEENDDGGLPIIKVVVPTDGSVPHISEFIENYSAGNPSLQVKIDTRRSSTIGLFGQGPSEPQPKEKVQRSKSMSRMQTMDQIVEVFRRKSSLRKWFGTHSISGHYRNKYDCRRKSSVYDDYLAKMKNISRNTLKFLLFPEKNYSIRIVKFSSQNFHDIDELTKELSNLRCINPINNF